MWPLLAFTEQCAATRLPHQLPEVIFNVTLSFKGILQTRNNLQYYASNSARLKSKQSATASHTATPPIATHAHTHPCLPSECRKCKRTHGHTEKSLWILIVCVRPGQNAREDFATPRLYARADELPKSTAFAYVHQILRIVLAGDRIRA